MARPSTEPRDQLEAALRRVLLALQPYAADVVLIGGWVPTLHQRYAYGSKWQGAMSLTSEADVLLKERMLSAEGRPTLAELLAQAGLEPANPDAPSAVWNARDAGAEKIEFLTPLIGPLRKNPLTTIIGQPSLAAISLPDLAVLSRSTTMLELPATADSPSLMVRVPTLGVYMLQKAATFSRRQEAAFRAKDLLYLRDVMAAGDAVTTELQTEFRALVQSDSDAERLRQSALANLDQLDTRFANELHAAAQMLTERDAMALDAASADLRGYLGDARTTLREVAPRKRGRRSRD